MNIDLDRVKRVVDILVKGEVIDTILNTMDNGFGEVSVKLTIQNGAIRVIHLTPTKIIRVE